jgi:hypothetical protein
VAHALGAAELPVSCGMAELTGGGLGHMHAQQRPLPPYDRGFASVSPCLVIIPGTLRPSQVPSQRDVDAFSFQREVDKGRSTSCCFRAEVLFPDHFI